MEMRVLITNTHLWFRMAAIEQAGQSPPSPELREGYLLIARRGDDRRGTCCGSFRCNREGTAGNEGHPWFGFLNKSLTVRSARNSSPSTTASRLTLSASVPS